MNILFASSEVEPFSKTGGLADVAGALPAAVAARGHEVAVMTPRYSGLRKPVKGKGVKIDIAIGSNIHTAEIIEGAIPASTGGAEVPVFFIGNEEYFDREELYSTPEGDYPDNHLRFAFFAKALLETAREIGFKPDIVHLNDWQSAIAAVYLKTISVKDDFFGPTRTLLTIHNLGYQGLFEPETIEAVGLPQSLFDVEAMEFYGKANFLKGGIVFSDAINTVSRKYADEIQTPELGAGLDGILKKRADRLFGILNGVDYANWNPETDKFIAANYSPGDMSGKESCKIDLLAEFGLPYNPGKPLIGMISRLAGQKGFDLIEKALPELMIRDVQMVILGTGEKRYHDFFGSLKDEYSEKLAVKLTYDNALAHKIEAGSDMFLMPSLYEPCGLNQMYSLKYGTVPIVRATGGLEDTITEWNANGDGNGFKFHNYSPGSMMKSIDDALKLFMDKSSWRKLEANGMAGDFSWGSSARSYAELYEKMMTFGRLS